MAQEQYSGLSLSSCVLTLGRENPPITEDQVVYIQTSIILGKTWEEIIEGYKTDVWGRNPNHYGAIASRLAAAGKLRYATQTMPILDLSNGYWLRASDGKQVKL